MLFQGEFISTFLAYVQHIYCVLSQWPWTTGQAIQMFSGKYLVCVLIMKHAVSMHVTLSVFLTQ